MKRRTDIPEDVQGDSETFIDFTRKLLAVPHAELKADLDAEKDMIACCNVLI